MKKIFIITITFLMSGMCYAQEKLSYSNIINITSSRNKSDIYESAKLFYTNATPGVAKTLLYFNSDSGSLSGKFNITFKPDCNSPKCIRAIGKVFFNVSIDIKNNTCYYIFNDFVHSGAEHAPGGPISFGYIYKGPCSCTSVDGGEKWKDEQWTALKKYINQRVNELVEELKILITGK